METAQIIEKIQNGLKRSSLNYEIDYDKIRIKMAKKNGMMGGIKLTVMEGTAEREEVSLKNVLDLNMIESTIVTPILTNKMNDKADEFKVDRNNFNVRFYTKQNDFYPSLYAFDGDKGLREIQIDELI